MDAFLGAVYAPLKRLYTVILKKVIGKFLRTELDPDQFNVQLSGGVLELHDIELNCDVLNEFVVDLPFGFVSATVKSFKITIPWHSILSESCQLEISGLEIYFRPLNDSDLFETSISRTASIYSQTDVKPFSSQILQDLEADIERDVELTKEFGKNVLLHRRLQQTFKHHAKSKMNDHVTSDSDNGINSSGGLELVESFVEQVVSQLKIKASDCKLILLHFRKDEFSSKIFQTELIFKFDTLSIVNDIESIESAKEKSLTREINSFENFKLFKLSGFRIELGEAVPISEASMYFGSSSNNPESKLMNTILHTELDNEFTMKLRFTANNKNKSSEFDIDAILRSVRILVAPRHIELLLHILVSFGSSSRVLKALTAQIKQLHGQKQFKIPPSSINEELVDISIDSSVSSVSHPYIPTVTAEANLSTKFKFKLNILSSSILFLETDEEAFRWPEYWLNSDLEMPSSYINCSVKQLRLDILSDDRMELDFQIAGISINEYILMRDSSSYARNFICHRLVEFNDAEATNELSANFNRTVYPHFRVNCRFYSPSPDKIDVIDIILHPFCLYIDLNLATRLERLFGAFSLPESPEIASITFPDSIGDSQNMLSGILGPNLTLDVNAASNKLRLFLKCSQLKIVFSLNPCEFTHISDKHDYIFNFLVRSLCISKVEIETTGPECKSSLSIWQLECCGLSFLLDQNCREKNVSTLAPIVLLSIDASSIPFLPPPHFCFPSVTLVPFEAISAVSSDISKPSPWYKSASSQSLHTRNRWWESDNSSDTSYSNFQYPFNGFTTSASDSDQASFEEFSFGKSKFSVHAILPSLFVSLTHSEFLLFMSIEELWIMQLYPLPVNAPESLKESLVYSPPESTILLEKPINSPRINLSDSYLIQDNGFIQSNSMMQSSMIIGQIIDDDYEEHTFLSKKNIVSQDSSVIKSVELSPNLSEISIRDSFVTAYNGKNSKLSNSAEFMDARSTYQPSVLLKKLSSNNSSSAKNSTFVPVYKKHSTRVLPNVMHLCSVKLLILEAHLYFHEDKDGNRKNEITENFNATSSILRELSQTISISIHGISLFTIVQYLEDPVSYIHFNIADLIIREYCENLRNFSEFAGAAMKGISSTVRSLPVVFPTLHNSFSSFSSSISNNIEKDFELYLNQIVLNCPSSVRILEQLYKHYNKTPLLSSGVITGTILITDPSAKNASVVYNENRVVIEARGITMQYYIQSKWLNKFLQIFAIPPNPDINLLPSNYQSLYNVIFNVLDFVIDYNPNECPSRLVCVVDKFSFSTSMVPLADLVSFKIEVRDSAVYLFKDDGLKHKLCFVSQKNDIFEVKRTLVSVEPVVDNFVSDYFQPLVTSDKNLLENPLFSARLRNLKCSVSEYLDLTGFARVMSLDFIEFLIILNDKSKSVQVECRNGMAIVFTCSDSFTTLLHLINVSLSSFAPAAASINDSPLKTGSDNTQYDVFYDFEDNNIDDAMNSAISQNIIASTSGDIIPENFVSTSAVVVEDYISELNQLQFNQKLSKNIVDEGLDVKWLTENQKMTSVFENHIEVPDSDEQNKEILGAPAGLHPKIVFLARELSLSWRIFGGHDWSSSNEEEITKRDSFDSHSIIRHKYDDSTVVNVLDSSHDARLPVGVIAQLRDDFTVSPVEFLPINQSKEVLPPFLDSEDIKLSTHANNTSALLTKKQRGVRQTDRMIELNVLELNLRSDTFGESEQDISRLALSVQKIEINDFVATSLFQKLLEKQSSNFKGIAHSVQSKGNKVNYSHRNMLTLYVSLVRPDIKLLNRVESRIKLDLHPFRLNIDQDSLEFVISFFNSMNSAEISENIVTSEATPPYIQLFESSDFTINIDYRPKRVDIVKLYGGDYIQLLHMFPLNDVLIDFHAAHVTGVQGFDKLAAELALFWGHDIAKHQPHRYVLGVQPIRSISNVGNGIMDMILMPVNQFKRDGRILNGLNNGAASLLNAVAIESLNVTAGISDQIQSLFETIESGLVKLSSDDKATINQSNRTGNRISNTAFTSNVLNQKLNSKNSTLPKRVSRPRSAKEGFAMAYESLTRGLQQASRSLVAVPISEYHKNGLSSAMKTAVFQSIPHAVLKPIIGTADAISVALNGVKNEVQPKKKRDDDHKFKST